MGFLLFAIVFGPFYLAFYALQLWWKRLHPETPDDPTLPGPPAPPTIL